MTDGRTISTVGRVTQIVFALIVGTMIATNLSRADTSVWSLGRLIYTLAVAGIAVIVALIRLMPFPAPFAKFPYDFFTSVLWWVAFGLLVSIVGTSCVTVFDQNNVAPRGNPCGQFKANIAFALLSALLWLVSASTTSATFTGTYTSWRKTTVVTTVVTTV